MNWAKCACWPSEYSRKLDGQTGAVIHQLTSHPSVSHPTYFLQCSFTTDQRHLLFTGYRSGTAQLFAVGFPDGEIRQLTNGEPIHPFSPTITAGNRVLFSRGGSLLSLDLETLEEALIVSTGGQLGECSLSPDGGWFVAACKRRSSWGLVVGTVDGSHLDFIEFPRTVIHPQFNPLEPEWIEFAGDPAPRMHRVRRDGRDLECLYEHGNDEFIVHETFLGESRDLVFCVWPYALKKMDWETREINTISEFNCWHITPNRDGSKIVCDTVHPDIGLQLIDAITGKKETVCHSKASSQGTQWKTSRYAVAEDWERARSAVEKKQSLSWMEMAADSVYGPQWTHPHPSFSRDETMVVYASDCSGYTQVYVAEVNGCHH